MAALYQLKRRLALADARIAGQQHALAVNLDEHAVYRRAGRKVRVQRAYDIGHKVGGVLACCKHIAVVLFRHLKALGKRRCAVAQNKRRNIVFHELLKALSALGLGLELEICALDPADYLQTLGVKVVVKARKLQCGTVDLR